MKYVDWVKQEYCYGDYSMIEAYLVGYNVPQTVTNTRNSIAIRNYTIGMRPAISAVWKNLKTIEYKYNPSTNEIDFKLIP